METARKPRYHDERQMRCTNLMCGTKHLANIFEHTDGRWYFNPGLEFRFLNLQRACSPDGYASYDEARAAAIASYEEVSS